MLKFEFSVDKAKNGFVIYYKGGQSTSIHTDIESVLSALSEYLDEEVYEWVAKGYKD